jgi:hypothetical protein
VFASLVRGRRASSPGRPLRAVGPGALGCFGVVDLRDFGQECRTQFGRLDLELLLELAHPGAEPVVRRVDRVADGMPNMVLKNIVAIKDAFERNGVIFFDGEIAGLKGTGPGVRMVSK